MAIEFEEKLEAINSVPLSEVSPGSSYLAVFESPRHAFQEIIQIVRKDSSKRVLDVMNTRLGIPFEVPYQAFLPNSLARVTLQVIEAVEIAPEEIDLTDFLGPEQKNSNSF